MKLEEALPHYRAGKTIQSQSGLKLTVGISRLDTATNGELLGKWTLAEEPKVEKKQIKIRWAPAIGGGIAWMELPQWFPLPLAFVSKENAVAYFHDLFALAGVDVEIVVE